jgi:hypothetical protein
MEKEAIDLNVVHDVAQAVPHVWNAIKDVGRGISEPARALYEINKQYDQESNPQGFYNGVVNQITQNGGAPALHHLNEVARNHQLNVPQYQNELGKNPYKSLQQLDNKDFIKNQGGFGNYGDQSSANDTKTISNAIQNQLNETADDETTSGVLDTLVLAPAVGYGLKKVVDFKKNKSQRRRNKRQKQRAKKRASLEERYAMEKTANQYIEKQGDSWVILQKGTGKVLSHHDSKEKAEASFRAMEMHKHGNTALDPNDWRNKYFNLDADW